MALKALASQAHLSAYQRHPRGPKTTAQTYSLQGQTPCVYRTAACESPQGKTLTLKGLINLFLVKHPTEDFYVGVQYYDFINKTGDANFDKSMDEVRRAVKLLADPAAGFKSKDADDHFLTAALLVTRYRMRRVGGADKTEPIDAEQSKQILQALADADWAPKVGGPFGFRLTPQSVFFRLGLTPKDGWTQPKDFNQTADEAKKWLKDNADKYRIERFVADKEEKKDDK